MDKKNMEILELDKIKEEIKKIYCLQSCPGTDPESYTGGRSGICRERLKEVTVARELTAEFGLPPFGGIGVYEGPGKIGKEVLSFQ